MSKNDFLAVEEEVYKKKKKKKERKKERKTCPRGVMVKAMDYGIVVCEFELQSLYYVYLRTNTLGKGM